MPKKSYPPKEQETDDDWFVVGNLSTNPFLQSRVINAKEVLRQQLQDELKREQLQRERYVEACLNAIEQEYKTKIESLYRECLEKEYKRQQALEQEYQLKRQALISDYKVQVQFIKEQEQTEFDSIQASYDELEFPLSILVYDLILKNIRDEVRRLPAQCSKVEQQKKQLFQKFESGQLSVEHLIDGFEKLDLVQTMEQLIYDEGKGRALLSFECEEELSDLRSELEVGSIGIRIKTGGEQSIEPELLRLYQLHNFLRGNFTPRPEVQHAQKKVTGSAAVHRKSERRPGNI